MPHTCQRHIIFLARSLHLSSVCLISCHQRSLPSLIPETRETSVLIPLHLIRDQTSCPTVLPTPHCFHLRLDHLHVTPYLFQVNLKGPAVFRSALPASLRYLSSTQLEEQTSLKCKSECVILLIKPLWWLLISFMALVQALQHGSQGSYSMTHQLPEALAYPLPSTFCPQWVSCSPWFPCLGCLSCLCTLQKTHHLSFCLFWQEVGFIGGHG